MTDADLLRRFADERSDAAFTQLVQRRIDFVYSAALRQLAGDRHRAQEATQDVFVALARKASVLAKHPDLLGWLYTSVHFAALQLIRTEKRRRQRKEHHAMQNTSDIGSFNEAGWEQVRPVLDAALHELNARDRQIVLLRFFEHQSFAAIANTLRLTENAAQKSADRALDKLDATLSRRGITSTSSALSLVLANHVLIAAPTGLTPLVTQAALSAAANATVGIGATSLLTFMTATKVTVGISGMIVATAIGLFLHERSKSIHADAQLAEQARATRVQRVEATALKNRLSAAEARANAAEADNTKLLDAVRAFTTAQKSEAAVTSAAPKKKPPPPILSRQESLAALASGIENLERSARANPRFQPYQPPDETFLSEQQRARLNQARVSATAQNQHFFVLTGGDGQLLPFSFRRIASDGIAKRFPALTADDWKKYDDRFALTQVENIMLLPLPKSPSPAVK